MRRRGLALLRVPLDEDTLAARPASFWEHTRAMHRALHQRSEDPRLIYEPRPGARVAMDYGPAAFSAQGLREDRLVGPPGAAPRVVMLGDSLVWGELVALEHSLPRRLQERLGAEVINLGVTGYDTAQEAAWYEAKGAALEPDVVVLVYCLNDMMSMSGPLHLYATDAEAAAYAAEQAALDAAAPVRNETLQRVYLDELRQGSRLRAVARHLWRWHYHNSLGGYTDDYLISAATPARAERTAAALAALGANIRRDGAEPVLVIAPAVYWWHRYPWAALHAQVRAMGEAAGFTVFDPLPGWREQGLEPDDWRFEGDNLHYNAEGNDRLAEAIAGALKPVLQRGR